MPAASWQHWRMVPTLHIDRVKARLYRVSIEGNGLNMTEPKMVGSIAE